MKISIFNSETFERWALRYIAFSSFFTFFIILLLLSGNYVGIITLCFFLWWYMVFSVSLLEPWYLEITNNALYINKQAFARSAINGFVIEIYKERQEIKNIILIIDGKARIFSINDSLVNIRTFLVDLESHIPMVNWFEQTGMQLFLRKIKL